MRAYQISRAPLSCRPDCPLGNGARPLPRQHFKAIRRRLRDTDRLNYALHKGLKSSADVEIPYSQLARVPTDRPTRIRTQYYRIVTPGVWKDSLNCPFTGKIPQHQGLTVGRDDAMTVGAGSLYLLFGHARWQS